VCFGDFSEKVSLVKSLIGKGGLYGNVIRIGPPLVATKSDIDELTAALDAAFAAL
jgi:4-aminobutyrate aminotransferase-like enzyme